MSVMPPVRAVLFDFDGTLADSFSAITASVNHVLQHFGRPSMTEEQVRGLVGHGLLNLMETVVPGADPEAAAHVYRTHHPSVLKLTRLLPGVLDGLNRLKQHGTILGICSNKPSNFTRALLDVLEIAPHFQVVFGPEDAGAAKPDPAMVIQAMAQVGVLPTESLFVGDMVVDVETGRRAGVPTWIVATGSQDAETLQKAGCDRLFSHMTDLINAIPLA